MLKTNSKYPVLAVLMLAAACARAQEPGTTGDELSQLPLEKLLDIEVVTASRFARKVSDAPTAVSIVTAEDIKTYGYRTLSDVLSSVRGLYVTRNRITDSLGGRGFGRPGDYSDRIMLLIDGAEANDNISGHIFMGNEGILDTELIERVEYAPGTGSSVYGNGAYFGVINIITKKGADFDGLQASGDVSSFGGKKGRVTYGSRLDNGADVLVSASRFDSPGQDLYFKEYDSPATNGGIAHGLDYDRYHRLFGKVHLENWTLEGGLVDRTKGVPTAAYYAQFNAPYQQNDANGFLNLKYDTDLSQQLKLSANVYYGQYHNDSQSAGYNPYTEALNGNWWGVNTKFAATWFEGHKLVFGAEYRDNYRQQFDIQQIHSIHSSAISSLYAQDEIALRRDLLLNVGARHDESTFAGGNTSPRLALIYNATEKTALKASWSTAYRLPTAGDMFYADGATAVGNPNLLPERVVSRELVLEHNLQANTRLTAVLYDYQTDDLIKMQPYAPIPFATQSQNVGEGNTRGFELEFEKFWDNRVRMRGSYAWQRAIDYDGQWMINSPENLGKFNLSLPLLNERLRAGLEVQYIGQRKTFAGTLADAYTLANLTLTSQRLIPNVDAAFSVRNLFNQAAGDVAPSYNQQVLIPLDGRGYWLQLTYRFR